MATNSEKFAKAHAGETVTFAWGATATVMGWVDDGSEDKVIIRADIAGGCLERMLGSNANWVVAPNPGDRFRLRPAHRLTLVAAAVATPAPATPRAKATEQFARDHLGEMVETKWYPPTGHEVLLAAEVVGFGTYGGLDKVIVKVISQLPGPIQPGESAVAISSTDTLLLPLSTTDRFLYRNITNISLSPSTVAAAAVAPSAVPAPMNPNELFARTHSGTRVNDIINGVDGIIAGFTPNYVLIELSQKSRLGTSGAYSFPPSAVVPPAKLLQPFGPNSKYVGTPIHAIKFMGSQQPTAPAAQQGFPKKICPLTWSCTQDEGHTGACKGSPHTIKFSTNSISKSPPKPKMIAEWPHICRRCGGPAQDLFTGTDCKNRCH